MKGLLLLLGESFRMGGQGSRIRGSHESYDEQLKACGTHISFIESIGLTHVYLASYNTQFNDQLLDVYSRYLVGHMFYDDVIGIDNLFQRSIQQIQDIETYDFILYLRVDLYLKPLFTQVFTPSSKTITFPTVCMIPYHRVESHPRVSDTILFIPNKYYKYMRDIKIGHDMWYDLIVNTDLTYDDLDVMISTYHDSDSEKDFNPLYYIVNRPQSSTFHSQGFLFDKRLKDD